MNIWQELGIEPTQDTRAIRRAYAIRLKQNGPEGDAEAFQRLRASYERATYLAEQARWDEQDDLVASEPQDQTTAVASAESTPPLAEEYQPEPTSATELGMEPSALPVEQDAPTAYVEPMPSPEYAALVLCEELLRVDASYRSDALQAQLTRPGWEYLDFREALEFALLRLLTERLRDYQLLVPMFESFYGWSERWRVRGSAPLIGQFLHRYAAYQRRLYIEQKASAEHRAAWALLSQLPDEVAFRRFTKESRHLKAMQSLLRDRELVQQGLFYYEANPDSLRWWESKLRQEPLATDIAIGLLIAGVGLCMIVALVLIVSRRTQPELFGVLTSPFVALPGAMLLLSLPLGCNWLYRFWLRKQREGWGARVREQRHLWSTDRKRVLALHALALLGALSAIPAGLSFWLLPSILITAALLTFWHGWGYATRTLGLRVWPLHAVLWIVTLLVFQTFGSPQWGRVTESLAPGLAVATYLGIAWLFRPFALACAWLREKLLGSPPAEPVNFAFWVATALMVMAAIGWSYTIPADTRPRPPVTANLPALSTESSVPLSQAPGLPQTQPNYGLASPAWNPPKTPRPVSALDKSGKLSTKQFDRLMSKAFGQTQPPNGARLKLQLTVEPDGKVLDAKVLESSFNNQRFDALLIDYMKGLKFEANLNYRATDFSYSFWLEDRPAAPAGSVPAGPKRRPIQQIQQVEHFLDERVQSAYRAAQRDWTPPPYQAIEVAFVIEPDGSLSHVEVTESGFKNPAFENRVVEEVKAMRFDPGPYAPTPFSYRFWDPGDKKPSP